MHEIRKHEDVSIDEESSSDESLCAETFIEQETDSKTFDDLNLFESFTTENEEVKISHCEITPEVENVTD